MTSASIIDLFPDRRRAVENARSVIRMDDATDDELHDACDVLFAWGEWDDRVTATNLRRAMEIGWAADHMARPAPAAPAPARVPVALRNLALAAMVAVLGYAAVRTVLIHRADMARIEGRAE